MVLVTELLLYQLARVETAFPLATARLLERFGPVRAGFVPFLIPLVVFLAAHLVLESPDLGKELFVLLPDAVAAVEGDNAIAGEGWEPFGDISLDRSFVHIVTLRVILSLREQVGEIVGLPFKFVGVDGFGKFFHMG
jgi:hypothetical protein